MQRPNQLHQSSDHLSVPVSGLAINDISIASLTSPERHLVLSPVPRVTLPPPRVPKKQYRPSTASSVSDRKLNFLPSTPSSGSFGESSSPVSSPRTDLASNWPGSNLRGSDVSGIRLPEVKSAMAPQTALNSSDFIDLSDDDRRRSILESLPTVFDPSPPMEDHVSESFSLHDSNEAGDPGYDWAAFIAAYASGKWDPHKTPHPPKSQFQHPTHSRNTASESLRTGSLRSVSENSPYEPSQPIGTLASRESLNAVDSVSTSIANPPIHVSPTKVPRPTQIRLPKTDRSQSLNIPQFSNRLRNSFTDIRSSTNPEAEASPLTAEIVATAATIRWAGARVSVAPLALPSPEHELTDPMRGVNTAIPGSHHPELFPPDGECAPLSPGRRLRVASFWEGTQYIDEIPSSVHDESASTRAFESPYTAESSVGSLSVDSFSTSHFFTPATAPIFQTGDTTTDDYFGDAYSSSRPSTGSQDRPPVVRHESLDLAAIEQPSSVPAVPRRICLTRQTSSPLPSMAVYDRPFRHSRTARSCSESAVFAPGRAVKEEQMFADLGYLVPPNPPNELERRRALYRFNIWNTGTDPSFQRIAYLVKLVFNTKIVMISLIDANEERWFKTELGVGDRTWPRTSSFCAHAILQCGDEPIVVLDAQDDWRFAKNPLVTGSPNIRFYAGAPLKTQEGFNIGTLSIIDDTPRAEFNPRQRHTLKEFATIAMREMELWRDKIQLRIRDRIQTSMEQFTRECLEIDREANGDNNRGLSMSTSMDQIYERAAKLVKRTLDVEGAVVIDVSHCQVLETMSAESTVSVVLHRADPHVGSQTRQLSAEEYTKLTDFFAKHSEGKISEGIVPVSCRPFLPTHCQYALTVPIFNIDKRPFALLCAYNAGDHTTPFLEGHELSYLRAIGVIILSAVLKRRMILADKAKSLFISNISHELRTPLHGILASAELLSDTPLNHSQMSFLQTVQACGTSLVETVNHVLDFTKLSGSSRSGGVDNAIMPSRADFMQLVEEAVEGCWIGHRARMSTSEIGSVYSPPDRQGMLLSPGTQHVETVIDIGPDLQNWTLVFEKGGIRRVLMNVFGNSLKFTADGYVHVMVRRVYPPDVPPNKAKIEMTVSDTGKGISQDFLQNQLFHPFSQENPMQTGTGLGLAIVNSIVRSSSVNGTVDVWSSEHVGTEIKVTFTADVPDGADLSPTNSDLWKAEDFSSPPTVSLVNFGGTHRGVQLLRKVLSGYLMSWGHVSVLLEGSGVGDIIIVNEDPTPVAEALADKDIRHPFILLSSRRGDPHLMAVVNEYHNIGGFCRILYKPGGPSRLHATLKLCVCSLLIGQKSKVKLEKDVEFRSSRAHRIIAEEYGFVNGNAAPLRYYSDLAEKSDPPRPSLGPRSITVDPLLSSMLGYEQPSGVLEEGISKSSTPSPTIPVGISGTLLKTSIGTVAAQARARVLVVEDNHILRDLLVKWLKTKSYESRSAVDGRDGVRAFESEGHFDIVLLDMSMPELDGVGATKEIRDIELRTPEVPKTKILALTGMSTLEDKRRAFEAGVDGYLVKPVAFKTLDEMFHKLGVS